MSGKTDKPQETQLVLPGFDPPAPPDRFAPTLSPQPAPTSPPAGPLYCEACGGRLPDMAGLNLPDVPADPNAPGQALVLSRDDAQRFRAAYLSLFAFWLAHQMDNSLTAAAAGLKEAGL